MKTDKYPVKIGDEEYFVSRMFDGGASVYTKEDMLVPKDDSVPMAERHLYGGWASTIEHFLKDGGCIIFAHKK